MSRTYHHGNRHIRVRGIRRKPTDLKRLARALIELEYQKAKAEADAQAQHREEHDTGKNARPVKPNDETSAPEQKDPA